MCNEFVSAFSAADANRLAAVYSSQGQALPPTAETVAGSDNIATFRQGALDMGIAEVSLTSVELDELDDTAI